MEDSAISQSLRIRGCRIRVLPKDYDPFFVRGVVTTAKGRIRRTVHEIRAEREAEINMTGTR